MMLPSFARSPTSGEGAAPATTRLLCVSWARDLVLSLAGPHVLQRAAFLKGVQWVFMGLQWRILEVEARRIK